MNIRNNNETINTYKRHSNHSSFRSIFLSQPIKHYRKRLIPGNGYSIRRPSIDDYNKPGGVTTTYMNNNSGKNLCKNSQPMGIYAGTFKWKNRN